MIPRKLRPGDTVRVIAPSCTLPSMPWLTEAKRRGAERALSALGLRVTYGKHLDEIDAFESTSVRNRIEDLHDAFKDPDVRCVMALRGGWNANQLLRHIDYRLIKRHPKVFCGFSDITVLGNAMLARSGLVTYSGPSFSSFCRGKHLPVVLESFRACVMDDRPITLTPSAVYNDIGKPGGRPVRNDGHWMLQPGSASGTIVGGNLCTLNLLQGTDFMPNLRGSIPFLEDDFESLPRTFDRNLQSLLHLPESVGIRGLVIGRFQPASRMTRALLTDIIATKSELKGLPVIANADFGHTLPLITFPIGGTVKISAAGKAATIEILRH